MERFRNALSLIMIISFLLLPASLSFAAEVIYVSLDKPREWVKKIDNLKIQGDMDGLVAGKSYIIRVQVYEDGGSDYSNSLHHSFTVEE